MGKEREEKQTGGEEMVQMERGEIGWSVKRWRWRWRGCGRQIRKGCTAGL